VSKARLNVFLEPDHASRLDELATLKGVSKSGIVATAVSAYLSPEGPNQRSATICRRLDALSRQIERLERDQTILLETIALWIRHQLAVGSPVPEGLQDAARAQGRARFADFTAQLGRHLQRGGSLVSEVWQEISPEEQRQSFHRRPGDAKPNGENGTRFDGDLA
jgi:predicted transcriptional regulator